MSGFNTERRRVLKLLGFTGVSMVLSPLTASCDRMFGQSGIPLDMTERGLAANVPFEAINFIKETENLGRVPAHHGTIAWTLLSSDVLKRLGYEGRVVNTFNSLRSFESISNEFPGGVFNRHHVNVPNYLNPRSATNANSSQLWIATQRPGSNVPLGTGYGLASDYASRMTTRIWAPQIAEQVTGNLQMQVSQLEALMSSGKATAEQSALHQRLSWELAFNRQRLELYNKINSNLPPDTARAVTQSMRTPVVLQYGLDGGELSYRKNPQNIAGIVKSGEVPHSKVTAVYYPSGIESKTLQMMRDLYPNVRFIEDPHIATANFINRMPKEMYQAIFKASKAGGAALNYLPLVGLVSMATYPEGVAMHDFLSTSEEWLALSSRGGTDMSMTEYYQLRSSIISKLAEVHDGMGNSLYQPLIGYIDENKPENPWQVYTLNSGSPQDIEMVIPRGTTYKDIVSVGDQTFLGLRGVLSAKAEVEENLSLGHINAVYEGVGSDGLPVLTFRDSQGTKIEPGIFPGLGKVMATEVGTEKNKVRSEGPEAVAAFLIRYTDFNMGDSVKLVIKPEVIDGEVFRASINN